MERKPEGVEGGPKVTRWIVTLYIDVPEEGAAWNHEQGIDALVWEMRSLLREKRKVWFEYANRKRGRAKDV